MSESKSKKQAALSGAARSAARVMDIFELLLKEQQGFTLREMSRRLDVPLSSLRALVQPLLDRGYLVRHGDLLIRLGPKLGQIAVKYIEGSDLITAADPIMEQISRLCNESVFLAILDGNETVCIHNKIVRKPVVESASVDGPIGSRHPAHVAACGKAILALLSPQELQQLYPLDQRLPLMPNTTMDKATLLASLDQTRQTGVAYNEPEATGGVFGVGSAIRDHRGKPLAGLSIGSLAARTDQALQVRLTALVKAAASVISYRLGYLAPGVSDPPDLEGLKKAWEQGEAAFKTNQTPKPPPLTVIVRATRRSQQAGTREASERIRKRCQMKKGSRW